MNKIFKIIHNSVTYLFRDKTVVSNISDYWKTIYPVGACYFSTNATSPQTLFGGTWVALSGYLKIGTAAYATGGSVNTSTVTLTTAMLPSHNHTYSSTTNGAHPHSLISAG